MVIVRLFMFYMWQLFAINELDLHGMPSKIRCSPFKVFYRVFVEICQLPESLQNIWEKVMVEISNSINGSGSFWEFAMSESTI